jgi:hypothetical protein
MRGETLLHKGCIAFVLYADFLSMSRVILSKMFINGKEKRLATFDVASLLRLETGQNLFR